MKLNVMRLLRLLLVCILLAGMLPVTALGTAGGFAISLPTEMNANIGDAISVPVVVKHTAGVKSYNSFDMSFAYDASALELTSESISGMSVTAENGRVRILRYGNDIPVGTTVFTLTFKAIQPGKTSIQVAKAKVGMKQTAQDKDASDAVILNDLDVVIGGKYQITVNAGSGGKASVKPAVAAAGEMVEITVTPKSGFEMKTLTVTDANGKNVTVFTDNNGKYSFVMPDGNVTIKVTFKAKSAASSDTSNPKTGDGFNCAAWNTVAVSSLMALAVTVINRKKIYRK